MRLTREQLQMLAGNYGPAIERALKIVVTLGGIYDAERLVPIESVQVAGVSFRNLGEAGLSFIQDWATDGARVRVPTTLNPAGMDMADWERMGISAHFAERQRATIEAYVSLGIKPTCTCTPYLVGNHPNYGANLAWSESSAVSFANSVIGARTNREGGPSALAAAICGYTAEYGLHLDHNRRATHRVQVDCPVREPFEYAALGYIVGREVRNGVPYFEGLPGTADVRLSPIERDRLKLLGAALAASGAVALYHVHGVTPEARAGLDLLSEECPTFVVDSLDPAIEALNAPIDTLDLVVIGCPHASLEEIRAVADILRGHTLRSTLWVTTSRAMRERAEQEGLVQTIEDAGGLVLADGCVVVAPMNETPYHTLATNSAKMAFYAPSHAGLQTRFGSLRACLEAAIRGQWTGEQEEPESR